MVSREGTRSRNSSPRKEGFAREEVARSIRLWRENRSRGIRTGNIIIRRVERNPKAAKEGDKGKRWGIAGVEETERGEGLFFGATGIRNVRRARYLLASSLSTVPFANSTISGMDPYESV